MDNYERIMGRCAFWKIIDFIMYKLVLNCVLEIRCIFPAFRVSDNFDIRIMVCFCEILRVHLR